MIFLRDETWSHPVPDHASFNSDKSMGRPIHFQHRPLDELQPRKETGNPPVPGHMSLRSDNSMGRPILFNQRPQDETQPWSNEAGNPKLWSLRSDESMGRPILFNVEHGSFSSRLETNTDAHQTQLNTIFLELERSIVSFVRAELKSFKRVLELDIPESFGKDESEKKTKEAFLNITLEFLRKMKQHKMADKLQSSHVQNVQHQLKSTLQQKFQCVFEGVAKAGHPTLLNQIYTELYITRGGTDAVNEEHEIRQIETTFRRQTQSESTIKCKDIFQTILRPRNVHGKIPVRTVLTKGVAGIGKTVLTQKFCLDWAEGKANQNIQLLFPFTFRELNVLRHTQFSLLALVQHCFGCLTQTHHFEYLQVLFIFDGLDECRIPLDFMATKSLTDVTESTSLDVLLVNLFRGTLLPYAYIWITTRPAAANQIPARFVAMVTEVRGFTNQQKEYYFTKRFHDKKQATDIIAHIKASRTLYIMCHMPIFCWIASTVLEDVIRSEARDPLPQTLTEMYIYFLVVQIKAKSVKYDKQSETEQWSPRNIEMVKSLAKLAFEQLLSGNLIFYESDLVKCGLDIYAVSLYSGVFTQVFREEPGLYQVKVYSFVHLTVQEFLAALHVHHTFIDTGINLLSVIKPSLDTTPEEFFYQSAVDLALASSTGHLDLFLRFLLGLSLTENQRLLRGLLRQTRRFPENHRKTQEYIKDKLNEGLPAEKSINLFHCLNELKDQTLLENIKSYVNGLQGLSTTLTPAEWSAVAFFLLSTDRTVFDLKKYQPSELVLLRLMPVVSASEKAILSACDLTESCCSPLTSVISSSSTNLRHLDLSHNPIQDTGVDILCSGLKKSGCRLETLNLSLCDLSWRSGLSLSSVFSSQCCSLRHLDLSNNDLQDSGVDQVFVGLRRPGCRLETLSLSGCLVSDKCSSSLTSALMTPKSCLKTFDLSYNNPGDSTVDLLSTVWGDSKYALDTLILEPFGHQWMTPGLRKYFCAHTLDSNTVSRQLHLSNRTVSRAPVDFSYHPHRDRFDYWPQVLCSNALSGRCYWEVHWTADWPGEKTRGVDIALSYRSISRKGESDDCGFGFNDQSWSLMVCYGYYFLRHKGNETKVGTFAKSNRGQVAIYLDCPAGLMSFYRVAEGKLIHIHTVNTTFTGPLFAGFGLWSGTSVSLPTMSSSSY